MKIFVSAGDHSGDLHGTNIIREIKKILPDAYITGFGGSLMADHSVILDKIADASIIGFWEPVKNIPRLYKNLKTASNFFKNENPDGVILIDYYGFNIHLAKEAKKSGIPVVYYVCPQVWATRRNRVKEIKKFVKKAVVIFPFEKEIYEREGIDCDFFGHPFVDIIPVSYKKASSDRFKIGIMPGSRVQEIDKHLTPFLNAFSLISKKINNAAGILPVFSQETKNYIMKNFFLPPDKIKFIKHDDYAARSEMDIAMTSSGTATVENTILGIPMVIGYKTSFLTYFIAKHLIKIKHIGMVNILSGDTVCPELIQNDLEPAKIAAACLKILQNKQIYDDTVRKLENISSGLGKPGVIGRAASGILEVFSKNV
ncbi:MAG: Lipid-A-disaccharide synthase [Elusimicrobia bacterium ADurb.Bin231]|nr:MAG: Lipid-A-disaccharide synthase [Elusimicrobia bacterium ADurb.Bin231]